MNRRWARSMLGGLTGLLAVGVAIGAGEVAAAFVRPAASPIIEVGNRLILLTPESVKRSAIRQFGTHDKTALLTGIYLVIAVLALVLGALAVRYRGVGEVGIAVFGAIGVWAALTTHANRASDVVPPVIAALAGIVVMHLLLSTVQDRRRGVPAATRDQTRSEPLLVNRRGFLQGGAAAAGGAALAGFGGRAWQHSRFDASEARAAVVLPSASLSGPAAAAPSAYDLGQSGVPFLTPANKFYRIDTALTVPQIDPKTWKLRIHGMVDHEITLTYDQLLARPLTERMVTLCCVSNEVGGDLISNALFKGISLTDLLREAGVSAAADQLVATSIDGMTIGSPTAVVMDGRASMLAVGMNGQVLPFEHGFPVRMVVPGLYGYVSACKWIVDLEATTFAAAQKPYWVANGWAAQAPVKLASRIDTPKTDAVVAAGTTVPIAGVAWDQHVGVSKIEVQVDEGPWVTARLAAVPSVDTWRQWVLPWQVGGKGRHTMRVRAFDANGVVQIEQPMDTFPSGATGYHSVTVTAK